MRPPCPKCGGKLKSYGGVTVSTPSADVYKRWYRCPECQHTQTTIEIPVVTQNGKGIVKAQKDRDIELAAEILQKTYTVVRQKSTITKEQG